MSRIICRRLPTCDDTGFILQNIIPPLPPNIITCCLPCTDYPIVGDGTDGNCIRIDSGNNPGDIIQWDGTTWIITPVTTSTVNTSFPITGDGTVLNPVTLVDGTDCANNLQFNTQLNQWLLVEPGGTTSASVGTFNALYPDVRTALAAGCTKLRIITDVTETNVSALNLASAGDSVVIHIDPGVAWTPPSFSNTFNGISLTITGSSEGSSSMLVSPVGLNVPLFVGGLTDNFVMEGIHWIGTSGGGGAQLINDFPIIRISYSTVTLSNTFFAFLGSFVAVLNNVLLSHVVINGGGIGCADVIHAEAGSKITMMDIEIGGTFLVGSGITINSSQSVLDTLTSTAPRFDIFVAGLVNNVQENTILNVINVNVYTPGTILSNMRISSLAFEHDQCICSNTIARGNVTISGDQSATNLKITNLECANLSIGLTGPCSQIQLTQCTVTGTLDIRNTSNLSVQTLTANAWIGDIVTPTATLTNWNLDFITIATDVDAVCIWVNSNVNGLQLTATSGFYVKNGTNGLDVSNSSLGVFEMIDAGGVLNNTNFSNINAASFTMSGLAAATNMHITNMTCAGPVTLGGSNSNTGNTVNNVSCTTFTMGNTGAIADWTVSNIIANGIISIGGNVRNCHFNNLHGTDITLSGVQNSTFDGLQTEGAVSVLTILSSCTDNIFSNIQCTSDFIIQGHNNNITGVGFGQNDTSPQLSITGHRNCISNVNALGVNTSGISFVCRGNDNSISNYYTSGSTANTAQLFIVTGASNKFSNIQLGGLNDLPIQSMTIGTNVIAVSGDYLGSRLTVGEFVTVSGTPSNDGTYRITALAFVVNTEITVTPAIPVNSAVVGTLSFPDVVVPPQALAPGNGVNNSRPFGTAVSAVGTTVGIVEFGGVSNQYSNVNIVPRSWFDTILNPAPPPVLIDVYKGVLITITSSLSHYTNLSVYKDAFHFTSPIPSPPAPNNAVPIPVAFQNIAITGELNRFDQCRIGPVANTSGLPGFGTFDASTSPVASSNSILGSVNMFTPLGTFPGQWIQTSYTGGIGINNLY